MTDQARGAEENMQRETVQRETMDVDILIVGGGSAGLACAIHLQNLVNAHNEKHADAPLAAPMIAVLEKAGEIGAHSLSGAVMNPIAIRELLPHHMDAGFPLECEVKEDAVYFLTKTGKLKAPITPPPFHNLGYYTVSISKVNRWLGQQAEALGINIFPGFAAVEALYEDGKIVGVRTGDKGRDKEGKPKANFEAGMDLKAKLVIFAEGTRGSLFQQVAKKLNLRANCHEEVFEEGVKELIQMPPGTVKPGVVIHTAGWPMKETVGGTFIYTMPNDRISIGLVGYMDTHDPLFDPHRELQKLKTHPFVYNMIKGGKVVAYGGKTLPAGGWYSIPQLYHEHMMVIGDTASLVDVQKLKGIHLAMKSGMVAAETALDALVANDFSMALLKRFDDRLRSSYVGEQLYRVRNVHGAMSGGMMSALPKLAFQELTGGKGLVDGEEVPPDYTRTEPVVEIWGTEGMRAPENQLPKPDGILFFDKLSSVYLTGTSHDEDSPNHLLVQNTSVCSDVCVEKYDSPCNKFCPAQVYEMVDDSANPGKQRLQINFTNCIHCKSCDIKCPFDNIQWTCPEGGGGPKYTET